MDRMGEYSSRVFWRFISVEFGQYFFRWRWIIPIPIALLVAYITIGNVLGNADNLSIASNIWDVIFSVFGNGYILFFVLNVVLIYLISDLPIESQYGELIVLRLHSRKQWWFGKILMLLISVLLYLMINVIIFGAITSFVLPWQTNWSELMLKYPMEFYLNSQALSLSPFYAIIILMILLILGWFGLGLATICLARFRNRSVVGFIFGLLINTSGLIALKTGISPPLEYLFIDVHLLFNLHTFNGASSTYPSVIVSLVYWMIWIIIFLIIGFKICLPTDFLSKERGS